jgi:hypothetical protein
MSSHAQKRRNGKTMLNDIPAESANAVSKRAAELGASLDDSPEFRASYMAHHLRAFLADQIRALRGEASQREFGELISKPQSVISRLEDEDYGKLSLQTLIDVATKLDIALVVRFVDFPTFLRITSDLSERAVAPRAYDNATRQDIEKLALAEEEPSGRSDLVRVYTFTKESDEMARFSSARNDNVVTIFRGGPPAAISA